MQVLKEKCVKISLIMVSGLIKVEEKRSILGRIKIFHQNALSDLTEIRSDDSYQNIVCSDFSAGNVGYYRLNIHVKSVTKRNRIMLFDQSFQDLHLVFQGILKIMIDATNVL